MDKQTLIGKIKSMAAAPSCCAELKAAAQTYLDAVGTADEKVAAQNLVAFAHSAHAAEIFGADGAKKFAAHADELKASGAKYCDCGACAPGQEILANKEILLA